MSPTLQHLCREVRRELGWSQAKLAGALGVTRVTVAHWEGGRPPATIGMVEQALVALRNQHRLRRGYKAVTYDYRPLIPSDERPLQEAWLAGFFEGEGSVRHNRHPGMHKSVVGLEIYQVNREPLDHIQAVFGGYILKRRARAPSRSAVFIWRVQGALASAIARCIYPLLSVRRQQQLEPVVEWVDGRTLAVCRGADGRFIAGARG